MSYRLRHYPYGGGHIDLVGEGELDVCRKRAAGRISSHRNVMEYPVTVLEKGRKWEMETGEDAFMIGDGEGILCIEAIEGDDGEIGECLNDEEDEGPVCIDCGDPVDPDTMTCERCYEEDRPDE
jgi:hypothetical protein